jgi:hypothetical protein
VLSVDDLVEPRPEQVALPRLPPLLRPHQNPPPPPRCDDGITARSPDQFARKPIHNPCKPANMNTCREPKLT